ncbi:sulfurtransferase [Streptomyces sp. TLI_171]|uniref:sulfurtransferase n=1 Tax=Streptomyces sp. TLI_171 TaxID=1938859 RepID=UPI000C19ACDE|nr:sulfurtransferase [Streptomyces sp. TLI_171]RKE18553.1 thiosulfate/3-mercaptopyruvate sulfurtransferase [Streptomyces sp. TLI_171]
MTALPLPAPLVDADWLAAHLGHPDLVVLDAGVGAHRHAPVRIPGARPFDIDGALSDHSSPLPHTMPAAADFQRELRALGVGDRSTVVAYDGAGVYSSPRAWWMLHAMGFDRAAVLDGGLPAWQAAGHPVSTEQLPVAPGDFTARPRPGRLLDRDAVAAALTDPDTAVLDARAHDRFTGAAPEPRPHLRGGHLPGSTNLPFTDLLAADGRYLPLPALRERLAAATAGRPRLVASCGSGVTACVLAFAAHLAGHPSPTVYDGSWSDWARPETALPVVTGP